MQIGDDARPSGGQEWWIGATNNQQAERLTAPSRGKIVRVGGWLRGVSGHGSIGFRICVWRYQGSSSSGNGLRGQTALLSASAAAVGFGNLTRFVAPLLEPVELEAGETFWVGFHRNSSGAHQNGWRSSGGGAHWHKAVSSSTPGNMNNASSHSGTQRIGFWVEEFEPGQNVFVRRSGEWVRASSVRVRRSGSWVEVDGVHVRRSGSWEDV